MELRHLRYFVAVAEELHFTRAAQRLHIGQPPLSQQIQALESELGVRLLRRHQRKVELTEAGRQFLGRAQRILADAELAAMEARRAARGEIGELSIGFTSSLPLSPILHAGLHDYRLRFPEVGLKLREMFTTDQYQALQQRRLDIGFVRFNGLEPMADIAMVELQRDALRVVISAEHPLAGLPALRLEQLRGESLIGYPQEAGTGLNTVLRELARRQGMDWRPRQEAGEAITQIGLVAAGLGIAILPSPLEYVRLPGVRYVPLLDEGAYLAMGLATRLDEDSPLVAQFLNLMRERWLNDRR
ncbi:LysR substrate-binding domain-containing protein [Chromobacterium haemolyticum]|uniref:LysR substrate-binding domain-containing protein n=1 Tax=Chromobacterium haemolyticum TaxID=394935 RepID=UPI0009DB3184|nr:LysR substrate-binding domain-containing protein [Chromobacterium haemolyticum]OQS41246.1 LysR family transcriptional regulator [Chromobacterium haemolyticum]